MSDQPAIKYAYKKSTIERYDFSGAGGMWASISVSSDIGLLQITSDFGDWSYRWIAPGRPFKEFLVTRERDADYLIEKLTGGKREVNLPQTRKALRERIDSLANEGKLFEDEVEDLHEHADRIDGRSVDAICASIYHDDLLMEKLFEDDCYNVSEVVYTETPIMARRFIHEIYIPWFVPELKKELDHARVEAPPAP